MDPYDVSAFSRRLALMHQRVSQLYRRGQSAPAQDLLSSAFDELQQALEELQAAEAALREQHQQRQSSAEAIEAERRHYCDLFDRAPIAYLVTTTDGTIRQVNIAGATMLGSRPKLLVGRSLALFVPEGERRTFRARVPDLRMMDNRSEWRQQLQPWDGELFEALLIVAPARDSTGRTASLRWIIHRLTTAPDSLFSANRVATSSTELEQQVATLSSQLATLYDQIQSLAPQPGGSLRERELGGA